MTSDLTPTDEPRQALELAERLLPDALETLRLMTPEGWELAYAQALVSGWHLNDCARLREARLLSMRAGGRFAPEVRHA